MSFTLLDLVTRCQPGLPLQAASETLLGLREKAEQMTNVEFEAHTDVVLPWLCSLLDSEVPVVLTEGSAEHVARGRALEVVLRLPLSGSHMRRHAQQLLGAVAKVVMTDSEDNALLAMRAMFTLHRHHRSHADLRAFLEEQGVALFAFSRALYGQRVSSTVR